MTDSLHTTSDVTSETYTRLDMKSALQLMAPRSWVASIAPVVIGAALTFSQKVIVSPFSIGHMLFASALMLITSIALQSAVNTFNDYADYVSGTDTAENIPDVTEGSIIFNRLDPADAKRLALACLAVALVTGMVLVVMTGWKLLVLGLVGVATVLTYSLGPKPLSYLPIGEVISGVVMGGIITVGTTVALSGHLDPRVFLYSLPLVIGIGVFMQSNNTCDIEKDIEAGRRTLPIAIGRNRSRTLLMILSLTALLIVALIGLYQFPLGLLAFAIMGLWHIRNLCALARNPFTLESRRDAMSRSVNQLKMLTVTYLLMIIIGTLIDVLR